MNTRTRYAQMREPPTQSYRASVFLGFCTKRYTPPPPWPGFEWPARIEEICSVSECMADRPPGWVDRWRFNRAFCWDAAQVALDCVPTGARGEYQVYAYHAIPLLFSKEGEPTEVPPDALYFGDLPALPPAPDLSGYTFLGYDVVGYWDVALRVLGHGCSPLSCNGLAAEYPVNRYCLLDSVEDALRAAQAFALGGAESGPYIVFLVWRRAEAGCPADRPAPGAVA